MFNIREHVELDSNNRALCPACSLVKGSGYRSKNLWVSPDGGGYHCHRGCTDDDIRSALGENRDRIIPTALASPPPKAPQLTPSQVKQAHTALLNSKEPLQWLLSRGISLEAIQHYRLGLARTKTGNKHIPAISIPIPTDNDATHYFAKKRNAPWLSESEQPDDYKAWSQYGIPAMVYFTHRPPDATETYLCEGEWDAIRLGWELRHTTEVAVACFTCGAGNVPEQAQLDRLPGKVTIFYDLNDTPTKAGIIPGDAGAAKVANKLKERGQIAKVPMHTDCTVPGWDVSDALNAGFTVGDFSDAAAAAKPWEEPKRPNALRDRLSTNDELLARAEDYTEWLIPDILTPNELFIMAAPPRTGKSLFCLTLAKAIATGGKFLDRPSTQGGVLYVNLEDSETKIKTRQIAQGWAEGMPVYWLDSFKLSELGDLKELITELPNIRLVILDTFSRIRDDKSKESSDEMGRVLEPLQIMARDMGICILVTHHTRKITAEGAGDDCDPFDLIRGNTAIRGAVRGALVIIPADGCYRIITENGYTERNDLRARINPNTLEWNLSGTWNPRIDGTMREQVIDYLNLHGSGTVKQIAQDTGFQASSIGTCLSKLQGEDIVSKEGGSGRSPAVYTRSFNLLQLGEAPIETYNPDTISDTGLLQRKKTDELFDAKVINGGKSDHLNDHFPKTNSSSPRALKQSCNPDGDDDVCFNASPTLLKQSEATVITGSKALYVGQISSMGNLCGMKHLEVLSIEGDYAEVKANGWAVTQTIPTRDLRRIR